MNKHDWLLNQVLEIERLSGENEHPGLLQGLSGVLEVYIKEVGSTEDERSKALHYLKSKCRSGGALNFYAFGS